MENLEKGVRHRLGEGVEDAAVFSLTLEGPGATTQPRRDAVPLVLASSLAASSRMWLAQSDVLARDRRVVLVDYPGHGGASDRATRTSVQALASALVTQLGRLGIDEFDFAGISLGALVGLQMACSHPGRVRRLMASNFRPFQSPESAAAWDQRIEAVHASGPQSVLAPTIGRWVSRELRERRPGLVESLEEMILETTPAGYAAAASAVRDFDWRRVQGEPACPVLLASSIGDVAAPASLIAALQPALHAHYVEFDTEAHLPACELPDAFLAEMLRFFDMP